MPKRKLRYVPGLISLLGLPVLFFVFPIEDPVQQNVLSFRIPTYNGDSLKVATDAYLLNWAKQKKLNRVYVNDLYADSDFKDFHRREKFRLISHELRKMAFYGDTSTGLQIEFGHDNTFGEWVHIQNLCVAYGIRRYQFINNSYYIFPNHPEKTIETRFESVEVEPVVFDTEPWKPPTKWEIFLERLANEWKETSYVLQDNLIVVIAFIILIVSPWIFWFRRFFRRKSIITQ